MKAPITEPTDEDVVIVDSVLAICQAMEIQDYSIEDLTKLFKVAVRGGRLYAALKMTMIATALQDCGDTA